MKRKSIGLLLLLSFVFSVMFYEGSLTVNAQEICNSRILVMEHTAREAGEICHCGGIRCEVQHSRYDEAYCDKHGAECDYKIMYVRKYYYCTNPNCTDTYYSEWRRLTDFHSVKD